MIRMSQIFGRTLREAPTGAELTSHKLSVRAGLVRFIGAGLYSYLPLGWRVARNIERILDEEMARFTGVADHDIPAPIVDYSEDYPKMTGRIIGTTSYGELRSGEIELNGKRIRTVPLSSYAGAREIALRLKHMISSGSFKLARPSAPLWNS